MATLYELTEEFHDLMQMAEEQNLTQKDIEDTLEGIEYEIEEKAEACAMVIRSLEEDANGLDHEIKRLTYRKRAINNNIRSIKTNLEKTMTETGKRKFKTKLFSFRIQNNPLSTKIEDESKIPEIYLIPQQPKIDKKSILKDLKAGQEVEGASLVLTESLRIQ
ncbi:MAG: siphovirus Gp157 family protein [Anaerostipes sp.]|uniref:siphovirus Gp157 family protein n=1 Tax=Anaerostipes sp. TaxID=1872530 RepID=UPI0039933D54